MKTPFQHQIPSKKLVSSIINIRKNNSLISSFCHAPGTLQLLIAMFSPNFASHFIFFVSSISQKFLPHYSSFLVPPFLICQLCLYFCLCSVSLLLFMFFSLISPLCVFFSPFLFPSVSYLCVFLQLSLFSYFCIFCSL